MRAIILAAGMGKRLHEISNNMPKCLLKVNNKPIIDYQIEACKEIGIREIIIVVGYKKEEIMLYSKKFSSINFIFVENKKYDSTNTLYSLYLTKNYFDKDFIYFNADVIFDKELLQLLDNPKINAQLLLDESNCAEEEVKIVLENDKIKEIGKKIDPKICIGEFVGIGRFNKQVLPYFWKELEYGIKHEQHNNFFEYSVNRLCKYKDLFTVSIKNKRAIEIDFPEDYYRAEKEFGN